MTDFVVDGMNVIGTRPDGWWRDRAGATDRLLARLQSLARSSADRFTLVLDGRPRADLPEGTHDGVDVIYARRPGRNAGDDRLVEFLGDLSDPSAVTVVTSDRDLADRAGSAGASVVGARTLLARLDEVEGD
jgi:predicted RNA-binding protein with PIN domain